MRTIIIVTVLSITASVFAYQLVSKEPSPKLIHKETSQLLTSSNLKTQDKLDMLISSFQSMQKMNQDRAQQIQKQRESIEKTLAKLDARLTNIEKIGEQALEAKDFSDTEQSTQNDSGKPKDQKVSEVELGQWMAETLRVNKVDEESTRQATNQTEALLEKSPNIILEDMQCNDRFCRAKFSHVKGEKPDIGSIFGEPPFLSGGFTVKESDGSTALYFAQPGETIEELRDNAEEVAFDYPG